MIKQAAVGLIIILLTGCGPQATPTLPGVPYRPETVVLPTGAPTPEPSPVNTRVLEQITAVANPTITPIPDETRGLVVQVMDGDTIAVVLEGDSPSRAYVVRYIGIDAPPNTPDNPWGVVAYETNHKMTNLKVVRLVRDQTDFDDEGHLLRYVYLGDESMMSLVLTEQGLARADSSGPNTAFQTQIAEAETRARNSRLGLWGPPPTPTVPVRRPTPAKAEETSPLQTTTVQITTTTTATTQPEATPGTGTPAGASETPTTPVSTNEIESGETATPTEESTPSPAATPPTTPTGEADNDGSLQGPP